MATLKEIAIRLKSVKSIQKITKSMKMVSAAKFARAERDLKAARVFGACSGSLIEKSGVEAPEKGTSELHVLISSDRGLCGAVHSSISRAIKAMMKESDGVNRKFVIVGDKVRGQLARLFPDNILVHFTELGRLPPRFSEATLVAQSIFESGIEFDAGKIHYNQFKSAISYNTTTMPVYSEQSLNDSEALTAYENESDCLQDISEFSMASAIYYAMKESATSEQSARMSAMDNATKNAGEMIDSLTLKFNRTRQAVITNELIEILSGAAALED